MSTLATILDELEAEVAGWNHKFMVIDICHAKHLLAIARAGERLRQEHYSKLDQVGTTPAKEAWDTAVEAMVRATSASEAPEAAAEAPPPAGS
jgi:hypothetical protein